MIVSTVYRTSRAALVAFSALASATAFAQTTQSASGGQAPFAKAPTEIRDFLIKAEAADKIEDPLARCLAFPDLPANKWPASLASAH